MSTTQTTTARVRYKSLDFMGYPLYRVGDDGSVWKRTDTGWVRRTGSHDAKGYPTIYLGDATGKRKTARVHALVLAAFVGPRPEGQETRHLNGNPTDNRLENLCYGPPRLNAEDRRRHGTIRTGNRCSWAKLREEDVPAIHAAYAAGRDMAEIAAEYGVSATVVGDVLRGKSFRNAQPSEPATPRTSVAPGSAHMNAKLTETVVRAIRDEYAAGGTSYSRLAKKYGVSLTAIAAVITRKYWQHI